MKLTIQHFADLGTETIGDRQSLITPESWDKLRFGSPPNSPFSLPRDRNEWMSACLADRNIVRRATDIVTLLDELHVSRIHSVGVGCAWLEYNLKRLRPSSRLICSDYAPNTVKHLRELFIECDEVYAFDILRDEWAPGMEICIFHRVDTELDDQQWQHVFRKASLARVPLILFLPSEVVSIRVRAREMATLLKAKLSRRTAVFAGYLRTKGALRALWSGRYTLDRELVCGDLLGFLLRLAP